MASVVPTFFLPQAANVHRHLYTQPAPSAPIRGLYQERLVQAKLRYPARSVTNLAEYKPIDSTVRHTKPRIWSSVGPALKTVRLYKHLPFVGTNLVVNQLVTASRIITNSAKLGLLQLGWIKTMKLLVNNVLSCFSY